MPILVDAIVSAFLVGRNAGFELDEQAKWSLETRIGYSNRIPSIQIYTSSSTHPAYLVSTCRLNYRALGLRYDDEIVWFWIGSLEDYEMLPERL